MTNTDVINVAEGNTVEHGYTHRGNDNPIWLVRQCILTKHILLY